VFNSSAVIKTTKTWFNEQVVEGTPEERAAAGGQLLGELAACLVAPLKAATSGTKAVKITTTGAKLVAHADDAIKLAQSLSNATKALTATGVKITDDAAGAAKEIADAAKRTNVASSFDSVAVRMKEALPDMRTAVESFRNRLNEMYGLKPVLADGDAPGGGYRYQFDTIKPDPPFGGGVHIKGAKAETPETTGGGKVETGSDVSTVKRNLKSLNNKEANKMAQDLGYEGAEQLKDDFVPGNGAKFNIKYDSKTGEVVLESIKESNIQVSTGLYKSK
jgi:hypothetical protein